MKQKQNTNKKPRWDLPFNIGEIEGRDEKRKLDFLFVDSEYREKWGRRRGGGGGKEEKSGNLEEKSEKASKGNSYK